MTTAPALPRISQWVAALEERKGRLTDPQRAAELDLLIEHLTAEDQRDLPRTLATVSLRGAYHSWGGSRAYTATVPEQADIYREVLDRSEHTFHLALEMERFFSGPDGICLDGYLHKQTTADEVIAMGHAVPPGADPGELLVLTRRMALFVSFVDGLMAGEDMYRDDHGTVTTATEWAAARPHLTGSGAGVDAG